ncbi:MAG: hypothetical protein KA163_00325 [Bacteroidia bacterium]|nr:hypothetical protein [Bacteroidia bacterium]
MKHLILCFLILVSSVALSQNTKPDLANLPTTDEVALTLKGLTIENTILQQQLIPLKQIDLKGENASKYKLVYYHFKTTYVHTFSKDDLFYDNVITEAMTRFFTDLEKNCKLIFDEVVVTNTETGKSYKIAPLNVVVKVGQ